MANEEHVAILKQGVEEWNAWREGNPGTVPNLSNAVLDGASLVAPRWSGVWMPGANLSEANLRGASLLDANLVGIN